MYAPFSPFLKYIAAIQSVTLAQLRKIQQVNKYGRLRKYCSTCELRQKKIPIELQLKEMQYLRRKLFEYFFENRKGFFFFNFFAVISQSREICS